MMCVDILDARFDLNNVLLQRHLPLPGRLRLPRVMQCTVLSQLLVERHLWGVSSRFDVVCFEY
jgi:hypothetical protein